VAEQRALKFRQAAKVGPCLLGSRRTRIAVPDCCGLERRLMLYAPEQSSLSRCVRPSRRPMVARGRVGGAGRTDSPRRPRRSPRCSTTTTSRSKRSKWVLVGVWGRRIATTPSPRRAGWQRDADADGPQKREAAELKAMKDKGEAMHPAQIPATDPVDLRYSEPNPLARS
jgi:hypothetical protein